MVDSFDDPWRSQAQAPHQPVLLEEVMGLLNARPDGVYIDATLGSGGHAQAILERLASGRLLGIDRDPLALAIGKERLAPYGSKVTLMQGNFADIDVLHA